MPDRLHDLVMLEGIEKLGITTLHGWKKSSTNLIKLSSPSFVSSISSVLSLLGIATVFDMLPTERRICSGLGNPNGIRKESRFANF